MTDEPPYTNWFEAPFPHNQYWTEIKTWCDKTACPENWYYSFGELRFRYPEHQMMFLLRWS